MRRVPTRFRDGLHNLKLHDASESVGVRRMIWYWCHVLLAPPSWHRAFSVWGWSDIDAMSSSLPRLDTVRFLYGDKWKICVCASFTSRPFNKLIGTCYVECMTNLISADSPEESIWSTCNKQRKTVKLLCVSVKFRDDMSNNTATIKAWNRSNHL